MHARPRAEGGLQILARPGPSVQTVFPVFLCALCVSVVKDAFAFRRGAKKRPGPRGRARPGSWGCGAGSAAALEGGHEVVVVEEVGELVAVEVGGLAGRAGAGLEAVHVVVVVEEVEEAVAVEVGGAPGEVEELVAVDVGEVDAGGVAEVVGAVGEAAEDLVGEVVVAAVVDPAGDLDGARAVPAELGEVELDLEAGGDGGGEGGGGGVAGDAEEVAVVDGGEDLAGGADGVEGVVEEGVAGEAGGVVGEDVAG